MKTAWLVQVYIHDCVLLRVPTGATLALSTTKRLTVENFLLTSFCGVRSEKSGYHRRMDTRSHVFDDQQDEAKV